MSQREHPSDEAPVTNDPARPKPLGQHVDAYDYGSSTENPAVNSKAQRRNPGQSMTGREGAGWTGNSARGPGRGRR
jgi:hypothetical protein